MTVQGKEKELTRENVSSFCYSVTPSLKIAI